MDNANSCGSNVIQSFPPKNVSRHQGSGLEKHVSTSFKSTNDQELFEDHDFVRSLKGNSILDLAISLDDPVNPIQAFPPMYADHVNV